LHERLDVSLVYDRSLEVQLKAPIPTICSTCEINVVKNMELAHYVDRLQDENDELRKLMGWLSGHEPQLRILIVTYKRQDGEALWANKVGEGSGENEGRIEDILEPPKTHHKNAFVSKLNYLRNRLDTTPAPPMLPLQTNNFQKSIKFKSVLGNEFSGKKGEKPSEEKPSEENPEPKENPNQSQNRNPSIRFVLTPVLSLFLTLALVFDFAGGRHGWLLVDRLRLLSTHDWRSTMVLQPHPGDDQRVHHFWG
jgi:hypothetical protein